VKVIGSRIKIFYFGAPPSGSGFQTAQFNELTVKDGSE
jgi:hypothetical protein